MEIGNMLKTFLKTCQVDSSGEQSTDEVVKQLEVLITMISSSCDLTFLDLKDEVSCECVTWLINFLLDSNPKPVIISRVLSVLRYLAKETQILDWLCTSFHAHSAVAVVLQSPTIHNNKDLFAECVSLLEAFTYKRQTFYTDASLSNLLQLLFKHVEMSTPELVIPCLSVLNYLSCNRSVQEFINSMPNAKQLYKMMLARLNHGNSVVVIHTLSILANLPLNDILQDQLFSLHTIKETLCVIFNGMKSCQVGLKSASVDLLLNLLAHPKRKMYILSIKNFFPNLERVLLMSADQDLPNFHVVLKLLLYLSREQGLRSSIYSFFFPDNGQSRKKIMLQFVNISSLQDKELVKTSLKLAADLFKELSVREKLLEHLELVQYTINSILAWFTQFRNMKPQELQKFTEQHLVALDILKELSSEHTVKEELVNQLKPDHTNSLLSGYLTCEIIDSDISFRYNAVAVVLSSLTLMEGLSSQIPGMAECLYALFQEPNVIASIASGLTVKSKAQVKMALRLACIGCPMPEFKLEDLLGSLCAMNTKKICEESMDTSFEDLSGSKSSKMEENLPLLSSSRHNRRLSVENRLQKLAGKIEKGQDIKGLCNSEILDVYEHKVRSLIAREQELQELLNAKTNALQQADRLLGQYSCRQAQREAETEKLRSLLRASERRSEEAKSQVEKVQKEVFSLTEQLKSASRRNASSESQIEELKEVVADQNQRLQTMQSEFENVRGENTNLSDINAMLQKHVESIKQKNEALCKQVSELEDDKKSLNKLLKEKEAKLKDYSKALQKLEEKLCHKEEELKSVTLEKQSLQSSCSRLDKEKTKLEEEVESLKLACRKHESAFQEKASHLQLLTDELEKHKHITEMIHNISSGKFAFGAASANKSQ